MTVAQKSLRIGGASMSTKKPHGNLGMKGWAWLAVGLAVACVPFVGPALGGIIDGNRINAEARAEKKALAKWYAPQIAAQLGIDPKNVSERDLELAAQTNPTFASMLDKVKRDTARQMRGATVAAVVGTPFSFMGAGGLAKLADMPLTIGASTVATMVGKDRLMVDEVADRINAKRNKGEAITAADVFELSLAHHKTAQEQIIKMNGKGFHKMPPAQQQAVMASMPDLLAASEQRADAVNRGLISEQDLVVQTGEEVRAVNGFSSKFQKKQNYGSFTDRVAAQRQMAAAPTTTTVNYR